jgi:hypothetical protein
MARNVRHTKWAEGKKRETSKWVRVEWPCAWLGLQVGGVLSKSLGRLARALCLTMARKFDTICEFPGASGDVQLNHLNVTLLSN